MFLVSLDATVPADPDEGGPMARRWRWTVVPACSILPLLVPEIGLAKAKHSNAKQADEGQVIPVGGGFLEEVPCVDGYEAAYGAYTGTWYRGGEERRAR
jgi:hypothetical protein